MESVPNFNRIIHSASFTFLIGPQHTKLTIQSGLAHHVSKPLDHLMNGPTRESKHRIAVLEEDDVETFVAFCEYAYTGDYSVPRPEQRVPEDHRLGVVESSPITNWRGNYRSDSMSSTVPPAAPSPPPQFRHRGQGGYFQSEPAPAYGKEPATPTFVPKPEAESVPDPKTPVSVAEPEPEPETYHEAETAPEPPAEAAPPADDEWAVPTEEPVSWEPEEPKTNKKKGKKGKKGKKQAEIVEEELHAPTEPVNLTPPSTPPPEVAAEPIPEPEAEPETDLAEEWAPVDPVPEAESEPAEYWAQPAEEAAPEPAPEPEPATEEPAPVEEQPTPAAEELMEESWTQDRSSGTSVTKAQPQRPMLDMSFAQHQVSSPGKPGLNLWDEFISLQYNDEPTTSKSTPVESPSTELPYITFHAKLYVFATRYLIPALAQLCLRKLHHDLVLLSPTEFETPHLDDSEILDGLAATKAQMVLELVQYAYTKTARLEPISPTSATQLRENELRRLVVHYLACNVKELSRYHSAADSVSATPNLRPVDAKTERAETSTSKSPKSLRALLDLTTELASDLVYRMM